LKEAERAAALRPSDTEASALVKILVKEAGSSGPAVAVSKPTANDEDAQPLERIKRTYNEASFKQAAFALEQMKAARGKGAL
jgi:hypothetical protein